MSDASPALSPRARAIIEAAEAAASGSPVARGLPVVRPRPRPRPLTAVRPQAELPAVPQPLGVPAEAPAVVEPVASTPVPASATLENLPDPARLLDLVQRIAGQAREVRRRLDTLNAALDEAEAAAGFTPGTIAPAPVAPSPPAAPVDVAPQPPSGLPPASPAAAPNETARLVAIEMAVGGASRREVQDRLVGEFGISDVRELLDSVYGPGSSPSSAMRWT